MQFPFPYSFKRDVHLHSNNIGSLDAFVEAATTVLADDDTPIDIFVGSLDEFVEAATSVVPDDVTSSDTFMLPVGSVDSVSGSDEFVVAVVLSIPIMATIPIKRTIKTQL